MIKSIKLDLDGVMADFDTAVDLRIRPHYGDVSDDEMWEIIHHEFPNWFLELPIKSGCTRLWNYANKICPAVSILTAVPSAKRGFTDVAEQKIAWVREHLSKDVPIITCLGIEKQLHCMDKDDVLIDDMGRNIGQWIKAGGIGILHHSVSQTINVLKELE